MSLWDELEALDENVDPRWFKEELIGAIARGRALEKVAEAARELMGDIIMVGIVREDLVSQDSCAAKIVRLRDALNNEDSKRG